MTDQKPIPDEIMKEAAACWPDNPSDDQWPNPFVVANVARALMARDERAAKIAREQAAEAYAAGAGPNTWDFFQAAHDAILTYGDSL